MPQDTPETLVDIPVYLTGADAARRCKVSTPTISIARKNGKIKAAAVSITGIPYYTEEEVERYYNALGPRKSSGRPPVKCPACDRPLHPPAYRPAGNPFPPKKNHA